MIEGKNNIAKILYDDKKIHINVAKKRMKPPYFDVTDIEILVDDVIISVLSSAQAKIGFKNATHLKKYYYASLTKKIRVSFFIRRKTMLKECEMSTMERIKNYNLAKTIINSNRKPIKS